MYSRIAMCREEDKIVEIGTGLFRWRYNDCHNIMSRRRGMKNMRGTRKEDSERGQRQGNSLREQETRGSGVITLSVKASS